MNPLAWLRELRAEVRTVAEHYRRHHLAKPGPDDLYRSSHVQSRP